ncbi:hypothetical protein [Bradyrhizobium sp. RDI18]|uniref:hypothetical protein n=1 Tax=Bradyrhizobium sp. RDI18 TaxID=3367400 RepID=UPI0037123E88
MPANDYPTVARADYVYVHGRQWSDAADAMKKCSCSIDEIANILPYAQEEAETLISVGLKGSETSWTHAPEFQEKVKNAPRAG